MNHNHQTKIEMNRLKFAESILKFIFFVYLIFCMMFVPLVMFIVRNSDITIRSDNHQVLKIIEIFFMP